MKKIKLLIFAFVLILKTFAQSNFSEDSIVNKFRIDTLFSNFLNENRFIKIWLPSEYPKEKKYPVFFVLDEDWMFEPVMLNVKQLINANVIPPSIVVGVHSNNRSKDLRLGVDGSFTESSFLFYKFINEELFTYLGKTITQTAFPILIGHSDGAVFAQKILVQPNQKFRAILCLSPQLAEGQFEEIKHFVESKFDNTYFHFIASGLKDGGRRLKSTMKLDSLFQTIKNPSVKLETKIYKIDHFAVGLVALTDGISFVFNDFIEENDWNNSYLDSLRTLNVNPVDYIKDYQAKINKIYNIDVKPRKEGVLSVANVLVKNKKQLQEYFDYETLLYGKDKYYNTSIAQNLERLNEFEEALKYWKLNLMDSTAANDLFFYYSRPIELIANRMYNPKKAIEFAEEWQKKKPKFYLQFNYAIAKICATKNIELNKGKVAIKYCVDNYKTNGTFTLANAKDLELKLAK